MAYTGQDPSNRPTLKIIRHSNTPRQQPPPIERHTEQQPQQHRHQRPSATSTRNTDTNILIRDWIVRGVPDTGKVKVTIMTWNVLADGLSGLYGREDNKSKVFAGVEDQHLVLEYRIPLILKEIEIWNCDIVCLQEFDFWDDDQFITGMRRLGYHEAAHRRKKWSPCLSVDPTRNADGVALFYKLDKFDCHATQTTDERYKRGMRKELASREESLRNPDQIITEDEIRSWFKPHHVDRIVNSLYEDIKDDSDGSSGSGSGGGGGWSVRSLNRWVDRPSPPVSAGALLVPKEDGRVVLYVMTSHLNASKKEDGEQRRSDQLIDLLDNRGHVDHMTPNTFLCLDMNGSYEPISDQSKTPKAYPFLVGTLPANSKLKGREPPQPNLNHMFRSATRDYDRGDVEVEWTSLKDRLKDGQVQHFRYPVDFLFYPTRNWNVTKVSDIVSESRMAEISRDVYQGEKNFHLPSEMYPSDHLAMCAEFQFAG